MIPDDNSINPVIIESIVRELASLNPMHIVEQSVAGSECHFCEMEYGTPHDSNCLWLRAKNFVEK